MAGFLTASTFMSSSDARPRWITLIPLAAFTALLAVTLAAGLVIRLGALTPSNVFGLPTINTAFAMHSSSAVILAPALLLGFVAQIDRRNRTATPMFVAIGLLAITLALAIVTIGPQVEASGLLLWAIAFIYAFTGVYAVYAAKPDARKRSWGVAMSGIAYLLTGIGFFGGITAGGRWSLDVLMAASLTVIAQEESGELRSLSRLALLGIGFYTVIRSFFESWVLDLFAFWGVLAMGSILVAETRNALRSVKTQHVWSRRYYVLAMVVFSQAILLRAVLNAGTIKTIHDTLFAVGALHLEYFVPALALLGLAHRDWNDNIQRHRRERLAWAAFVLITIGSHVMAWSFVALGLQGMPRRMQKHLELFQPLHIVCTIGAIMLVVGIAAAMSALWSSRSDKGHVFDQTAA